MRTDLKAHVRWGDLDAYGHVNNVAAIQLLEEARVELFWRSHTGGAAAAAQDLASFVVRQEIEYLAPIPYPNGPIPISVWVSRIGRSSIDVCYELRTEDDRPAVRAVTTVVMVDPATGAPRRLRDDEKQRLESMVDEPVEMKKRA